MAVQGCGVSRNHTVLNQARWRVVRKRILDRDGWRCVLCGKYGNECDHVLSIERGGAVWDETNLQTLCQACHIAKTARENQRTLTSEQQAWRAFLIQS